MSRCRGSHGTSVELATENTASQTLPPTKKLSKTNKAIYEESRNISNNGYVGGALAFWFRVDCNSTNSSRIVDEILGQLNNFYRTMTKQPKDFRSEAEKIILESVEWRKTEKTVWVSKIVPKLTQAHDEIVTERAADIFEQIGQYLSYDEKEEKYRIFAQVYEAIREKFLKSKP